MVQPITWIEWCDGGYESLEICNRSNVYTWKYQFSPTASPIPGYDPDDNPAVPPGIWEDISKEMPMTPIITMTAPVGTLARVAILTDAIPTNLALAVKEWINTPLTGGESVFQWFTGTSKVTITNQLDPTTNLLTPSVTYLPGRGVYLPASENAALISGMMTDIPPLTLVPSQIDF